MKRSILLALVGLVLMAPRALAGPGEVKAVSVLPGAGRALVVIDVQERLAAAMDQAWLRTMLENTQRLLQGMEILACPYFITEQYPRGLGETVAGIQDRLYVVQGSDAAAHGEGDVDRRRDGPHPTDGKIWLEPDSGSGHSGDASSKIDRAGA